MNSNFEPSKCIDNLWIWYSRFRKTLFPVQRMGNYSRSWESVHEMNHKLFIARKHLKLSSISRTSKQKKLLLRLGRRATASSVINRIETFKKDINILSLCLTVSWAMMWLAFASTSTPRYSSDLLVQLETLFYALWFIPNDNELNHISISHASVAHNKRSEQRKTRKRYICFVIFPLLLLPVLLSRCYRSHSFSQLFMLLLSAKLDLFHMLNQNEQHLLFLVFVLLFQTSSWSWYDETCVCACVLSMMAQRMMTNREKI